MRPAESWVTSLAPAFALREAWREGYGWRALRADLLAGLVVGTVALPLSMALAIASGVPPRHGLYTAIVAGALTAVAGGSRVQVTGPTAAFVVVMAPISARFGLQGLALASALAGLMLLAMGLLRLGRLIQFMPYPVTTGFTAGIGLVIATLQIPDFLGLVVEHPGEHWHERVLATARALPSFHWADALVGGTTLAILLAWRRVKTAVPAPIVALTVAALLAMLLERLVPGLELATLARRFGTPDAPSGIPQSPPLPLLPWLLPGPGGGEAPALSLAYLRELLPAAFTIAMLGAIESLLSAVVSDGMSGFKHNPDVELTALGLGNLAAPFFGGFAATGAIARTATNVKSGARSPIAAVVHAAFVLASVLTLAPALGRLPMAALAGLLLLVAWNMSEARHFVRVVRTAPRSDAAVLFTCFAFTVVFDMTIAVAAGVMLAALLFMRRMIEISGARLIGTHHPEIDEPLPPGLLVYDVAGPLFFGAAAKATSSLLSIQPGAVRSVILDLTDVPAIDATGLVNLESALARLGKAGVHVSLAGLQAQPRRALEKARILGGEQPLEHHPTFRTALAAARARLAQS